MSWGAATITHRNGRYVRHTYITAVCTLEGQSTLYLNLDGDDGIPTAIYGGTVEAESNGGTVSDNTTLAIRTAITELGNSSELNIYQQQITIADGTNDYFPIYSIFKNVGSDVVNYMGGFCIPTNEISFVAFSSNAAQTTETVTVHIGLLSHRLEV